MVGLHEQRKQRTSTRRDGTRVARRPAEPPKFKFNLGDERVLGSRGWPREPAGRWAPSTASIRRPSLRNFLEPSQILRISALGLL